MALILLVKVQSRVFTAKCSEPQADASNGMGEGSGVAKFLSLRTETCGARMKVVNFIISKDLLENRIKDGLSKSWNISCRAVYETRTYGSMGGARVYSPSTLFISCFEIPRNPVQSAITAL